MNRILTGDALECLRTLPGGIADMCVTSPPYYGLRDYGVDGQIGLERSPEEYVGRLVDVFREVRRVLLEDGTLWLNLGDCYYSHRPGVVKHGGLKKKDLVGIPWMVAFALRADGWYLRQDIVWHKPNPMPESVKDRCTRSHEFVFLLSKSPNYYFAAQAIKEAASSTDKYSRNRIRTRLNKVLGRTPIKGLTSNNYLTRNKRDVWHVSTKPYHGAHFAVFPEELIFPCILAGCREGGIVLDPFLGSGTTAVVALSLRRKYIGCELNPDYVKIAESRLNFCLTEEDKHEQ